MGWAIPLPVRVRLPPSQCVGDCFLTGSSYGGGGETEREKERKRGGEIERQRQRGRETNRERERQRERESERQRQRKGGRDRETERIRERRRHRERQEREGDYYYKATILSDKGPILIFNPNCLLLSPNIATQGIEPWLMAWGTIPSNSLCSTTVTLGDADEPVLSRL